MDKKPDNKKKEEVKEKADVIKKVKTPKKKIRRPPTRSDIPPLPPSNSPPLKEIRLRPVTQRPSLEKRFPSTINSPSPWTAAFTVG